MLHDLCIGQDESKMKDLVNRLFPPTYGQQDMHIPVTQPVARSLLVIDNQTIETNATAACCSRYALLHFARSLHSRVLRSLI